MDNYATQEEEEENSIIMRGEQNGERQPMIVKRKNINFVK